MCPAGQSPVLAAYDRATGSHQWSACLEGHQLFVAVAATDQVVYASTSSAPASFTKPWYLAYDTAGGEQLWVDGRARYDEDAGAGAGADAAEPGPPIVQGIRLTGGQDDPLVAYDTETGDEAWRAAGRLPYDDVWAVGDGAVWATECCEGGHEAVVGRELASGEVRWSNSTLPGPAWHVSGKQLFALWFNLAVVDTRSGEVIWQTAYPEPSDGFPRMTGAVANGWSVFVSFTGEASPGD